MTDAGQPIYIDIQSSEIMALEDVNSSYRLNLGYISGEFSHILTDSDLYVKVYFKRGIGMEWEDIEFKLNRNKKIFRQKLPAGLTVTNFYVQLYGEIKPTNPFLLNADFELTDFEISVKKIPIGKHAGEPLGLEYNPPSLPEPYFMRLDLIGEVDAISAKAVVYTSKKAIVTLSYGLLPIAMNNILVSPDVDVGKYHEFQIMGLIIDTTYYAQFRAVNAKTGEELLSKIHVFKTGREVTVTNTLYSPSITSTKQTPILIEKTLLDRLANERLLTLDPDNIMGITHYQENSIKLFISNTATNLIDNTFNTSIN